MAKLTALSAEKKGWSESYGELELNQVAFPFTGRIEAQMPLAENFIGEVGMILVVDKWDDKAVRAFDEDKDDEYSLFALNYSTETVYDERKGALHYFHQVRGTGSYDWLGIGDQNDIYPRLGYLSVGDRFTTSAITVDETTAAAFEANIANYNGNMFKAGTDGYWVAYDEDEGATNVGPIIKVIDAKLGMPDGSYGFKVEVVKA